MVSQQQCKLLPKLRSIVMDDAKLDLLRNLTIHVPTIEAIDFDSDADGRVLKKAMVEFVASLHNLVELEMSFVFYQPSTSDLRAIAEGCISLRFLRIQVNGRGYITHPPVRVTEADLLDTARAFARLEQVSLKVPFVIEEASVLSPFKRAVRRCSSEEGFDSYVHSKIDAIMDTVAPNLREAHLEGSKLASDLSENSLVVKMTGAINRWCQSRRDPLPRDINIVDGILETKRGGGRT